MICPYEKSDPSKPCQGTLYRDIKAYIYAQPKEGQPNAEVSEITYPYSVVMNQECDLHQDYTARQASAAQHESAAQHDTLVPSVLMCPAYFAAQLKLGEHLKQYGRVMERINSDRWKLLKQNQNPRYHYLASWPAMQVQELVIDFKHFFTVPTEQLHQEYATPEHCLARLAFLYREDLSQRFASYMSRIGLPVPHHQIEIAEAAKT